MANCCDHDDYGQPGKRKAHDHAGHDHPPSQKKHRVVNIVVHDGHDHGKGACCAPPPVALNRLAVSKTVGNDVRTSMRIMQMDCPTEEALIRSKLKGISSVRQMEFNLMQRVLTVIHAPAALEPVLSAIRSLGFEPELPNADGALTKPGRQRNLGGRWLWRVSRRSLRKRSSGSAYRLACRLRSPSSLLSPAVSGPTGKAGSPFATETSTSTR